MPDIKLVWTVCQSLRAEGSTESSRMAVQSSWGGLPSVRESKVYSDKGKGQDEIRKKCRVSSLLGCFRNLSRQKERGI